MLPSPVGAGLRIWCAAQKWRGKGPQNRGIINKGTVNHVQVRDRPNLSAGLQQGQNRAVAGDACVARADCHSGQGAGRSGDVEAEGCSRILPNAGKALQAMRQDPCAQTASPDADHLCEIPARAQLGRFEGTAPDYRRVRVCGRTHRNPVGNHSQRAWATCRDGENGRDRS